MDKIPLSKHSSDTGFPVKILGRLYKNQHLCSLERLHDMWLTTFSFKGGLKDFGEVFSKTHLL